MRLNVYMRLHRNQHAHYWVLGCFVTLSLTCQHGHFQNNQLPILFSPDIRAVWFLQTWQNSKPSIKAEQSVVPIYKQEPKALSMHSWLLEGICPQVAFLPPKLLCTLSQMIHLLYHLPFCLQDWYLMYLGFHLVCNCKLLKFPLNTTIDHEVII